MAIYGGRYRLAIYARSRIQSTFDLIADLRNIFGTPPWRQAFSLDQPP